MNILNISVSFCIHCFFFKGFLLRAYLRSLVTYLPSGTARRNWDRSLHRSRYLGDGGIETSHVAWFSSEGVNFCDKTGEIYRYKYWLSWSFFFFQKWIVIHHLHRFCWLEVFTIQKNVYFSKLWFEFWYSFIQGEEPWAIWSWSSPQHLAWSNGPKNRPNLTLVGVTCNHVTWGVFRRVEIPVWSMCRCRGWTKSRKLQCWAKVELPIFLLFVMHVADVGDLPIGQPNAKHCQGQSPNLIS